MAMVVFFRAVNVGGFQKFQPGKLAKELAELEVVNIGAAGTYVVRAKVSRAKVQQAIWERMQFKPELMICDAAEVRELVRADPFKDAPGGKEIVHYVTVMPKAAKEIPPLPIVLPAKGKWDLQVFAVSGRFALSVKQPGSEGVYPNAVVEKQFGVSATTRNWNTMVKICAIAEAAGEV